MPPNTQTWAGEKGAGSLTDILQHLLCLQNGRL